MTVRPAVAADLPAVRAVDAEAFGAEAWSAAAWQREWEGVPAMRQLTVAVVDGRVVGFGVLSAIADVADLHRVAVVPGRRRRGLGIALVESLIADARRRGCVRMLLEVEDGNEPAVALYDRLGFVEIDRRTSYYGAGRDALVLALGLD